MEDLTPKEKKEVRLAKRRLDYKDHPEKYKKYRETWLANKKVREAAKRTKKETR